MMLAPLLLTIAVTGGIQPAAETGPLQLGRMALAAGRLAEAEAHLQTALAQNPPRVFEVYFALGRVYLQERRFGEARDTFGQAIQRAPRFGPARVGRARACLFLDDMDGALADLESALAIPDVPIDAVVLKRELEYYRARSAPPPIDGRSARESALRRALGEDLASPEGYIALGVYYFALGETSEAIRALEVAQAIDDLNPIVFLLLKAHRAPPEPFPELFHRLQTARQAWEIGDGEAATAIAREILERRPLFVPARLLLIQVAEARSRELDALLEYQALAESLPGIPPLRAEVARLASRVGAFELAECSARRALDLEPKDAGLHALLATSQLAAAKAERALSSCERALALGIATAPIYFTLGNVHHAHMELSSAIAAFQKAVELDPQAAENLAAFALSSLTTDDYAALRRLLEAHVLSHPRNVNTLYGLGVMYLRDGEATKAKPYFERVRALAPNPTQAEYNLALIYEREGQEQLAQEALARFRELESAAEREWQDGRRVHDERIKARDALGRGEVERAVGLWKAIVSERSHEASDWVGLGESSLAAGKAEDARVAFEKALAESPYLLEAVTGMARALEALGDRTSAARFGAVARLLTTKCP